MTPEQRMKFMVRLSVYRDASEFDDRMGLIAGLVDFVEHLEFLAHSDGQDLQIALHEEHVARAVHNENENCSWRADI